MGNGAIALVDEVIDCNNFGGLRSGLPRTCKVLLHVQHAIHAAGFVVATTLEEQDAENGPIGGFDLFDEFGS